jgi:hypothetical protein
VTAPVNAATPVNPAQLLVLELLAEHGAIRTSAYTSGSLTVSGTCAAALARRGWVEGHYQNPRLGIGWHVTITDAGRVAMAEGQERRRARSDRAAACRMAAGHPW